ncbi:MAG: DegV family protein [Clostridiales bacterium]|nr:DegV family protein [Clostridiales bacterium]
MSYKIILDSCGELTDEMQKSGNYINVPLTLQVGETKVIDDETFNQKDFLELVASTSECPKSSCPSPEEYMNAYDCKCDRVYVVTLSDKLSGSYNSACLAKKLYSEVNPFAKIHVIDSKSASAGETLIGMKIAEYENMGFEFEKIVELAEEYRDSIYTLFVLEDLSFLERNGRLTGVKRLVANLLHIVPIMGSTPEGTIYQVDQTRGFKKAMSRLVDIIVGECEKKQPKDLVIAHCNCPERAEDLKEKILARYSHINININDTKGVASLYAGNKGIIVAL